MSTAPSTVPRERRRSLRLAAAAGVTLVATSGCNARHVYESSLSLGFPHPVTDQGKRIYDVWLGSVAAGAIVGLFVWGLIVFAVVRYRKSSDELPRQVRYNLPIEVLYTVVPFVVIAVLFFYTARDEAYVNRLSAKPDMTVQVVGFKWNWQFQYQDAGVQVTGETGHPAQLVLPTDRSIRFIETSPDVIHSFWVPSFLFKRDVVPGRANQFELTVRTPGTYVGHCAELCGEKHSRMNFSVRVLPAPEYDAYIAQLKADPNAAIGSKTADGSIAAANAGSIS